MFRLSSRLGSVAGQTSSDTRTDSKKSGMNFLRLIVLGGWFMIPLGLISLVVVALAIQRGLALRRERQLPERLLARLGQLCEQPGGLDPAGRLSHLPITSFGRRPPCSARCC
jgi:biopolymer transport protein ExbB/TolQ